MSSPTPRDVRRDEEASSTGDASTVALDAFETESLVPQNDDGPEPIAPPGEVARPESRTPFPDSQFVQARLGIASALFTALRCRDVATASHALRVTLGCSAWSMMLELDEENRDAIEVAALLHDVGKVGIPDSILLKPGPLTADETAIMRGHRQLGLEILQTCCSRQEILDIVAHAPTWFDGTQSRGGSDGINLPLGARMLSIVDAYDSMTTDKVYRRALSRERAISELYSCSGTQFDPELVRHFSKFDDYDSSELQEIVGRNWLGALDLPRASGAWGLNLHAASPNTSISESLFQQQLVDNMNDAVVFVDSTLKIIFWNHGAERLTGVGGSSVQNRRWSPDLLELTDERGNGISDADCPLLETIRTCQQRIRRLTILGRSGRAVSIEAHMLPILNSDGIVCGCAMSMHDVSSELSLEARCQSLHELATKDPLTQVANRAEFNRVHEMFVVVHLEQRLPCSLIISDIDHFKQVNDTFGHQAGDEVLKSFAELLKRFCRPGDLVSRYGGEEFVILCTDCDNAVAARRAESLRHAFAEMTHTALEGRCCTSSFGVTEIQPGDTPETMLRRADRALFCAKEKGRNTVVQLGTGIGPTQPLAIATQGLRNAVEDVTGSEELPQKTWLLNWLTPRSAILLQRVLTTPVPLSLALEKLRGFVSDHHGRIQSVEDNRVSLRIGAEPASLLRRRSDPGAAFLIELRLEEKQSKPTGRAKFATGGPVQTQIFATVRPERARDRRQADALQLANQPILSLRAYLVRTEQDAEHAFGRE